MLYVALSPEQFDSLLENAVSHPWPSFWYLDPCPSEGMRIVLTSSMVVDRGRIV